MKIGFDNDKYLALQAQHIRARREQFGDKLYIEFGGKLFDDYHASRVLPGFQPDSKIRMLASIRDEVEIVVAICAGDIEKKKIRGDLGIGYDEDVLRLMDVFRGLGFYVGSVVITQYAGQPAADAFIKRLTALGGMRPENGEAENVRVYTRSGRVIEGTFQLCNASVHVNGEYANAKRSYDTCEVVLDEDVKSADDTRALGVEVGDIVCFEPRTRITGSGYIKSRFLDDKLSVGILLGLAKFMKDKDLTPRRRVYAHVTVYEEVGHGGAASVPQGVTEAISVDMGCVGDGLRCTERQVSICAKDSGGPYSYEVVGRLMDAARREKADYAVDVYPHYGSDVEATLSAGNDLRHGLIGAGVYASHGYERSHIDGVWNTLKVLKGYLEI